MKKLQALIGILVVVSLLVVSMSSAFAVQDCGDPCCDPCCEPNPCPCPEGMAFDVPDTAQVGSTITVTGTIATPNGPYIICLLEDLCDDCCHQGNSIMKWEGNADCDGNVCTEIKLPYYVVGYEDMKMCLKDVQASHDSIGACCACDIIQFTCLLEVEADEENCLGDQIADPCEAVEVYGYGYPRYGDVMGSIEDCGVCCISDCAVVLDEANDYPGRDDGYFESSIVVDKCTLPGKHSVVAEVCDTAVCCADLWVDGEFIVVTPNSADPGDTVTVTGMGWGPNPCDCLVCEEPEEQPCDPCTTCCDERGRHHRCHPHPQCCWDTCEFGVEIYLDAFCLQDCCCDPCEENPCDEKVLLGVATPDECGNICIEVTIPDCIECGFGMIKAQAVCDCECIEECDECDPCCEEDCVCDDKVNKVKHMSAMAPILIGTDIWLETGQSGTFFILGSCFPMHWPFNVCDYYPELGCDCCPDTCDEGCDDPCDCTPDLGPINDLYFTWDETETLFAIDMSEQAYLCNPLDDATDCLDVLDDMMENLTSFLAIALVPTDAAPGVHTVGVHMHNVYGTGINIDETAQICIADLGGADGVDGQDGKDGVDGKDGKDGADGADGADGKDGADGADGKDGVDGKDGAQGPAGPQGEKGDPGEPGSTSAATSSSDSDDSGIGIWVIALIASVLGLLALGFGGVAVARSRS